MGLARRLLYWALWSVNQVLLKTWFRHRVEGAPEALPRGPLVLAANHCSWLDPIVLAGSVRRRVVFLVTSAVFYQPHMRPWMWLFGCIPVEEGRSNREAIRAALDELRGGCAVGIFPEGGISDDGRLQEGQTGVASLILQGRAKVLPAALVGPFESLPRGGGFPRPVALRTRFGPVLSAEEVVAGKRGNAARVALRDRIMKEIAAQLPEHQRPCLAEVPEAAR